MQTLYSKIREDRIKAIKEKRQVAKSVLTTLVGELETKEKSSGKAIADADVLHLIKKFIDANNESIKCRENDKLREENTILEEYLPEQMTESEIRAEILSLGTKNIGQIMGHMNANFNGKFDRALAAKIAKSL